MTVAKKPSERICVLFLHTGCNMWCSYCVTENNIASLSDSDIPDLLHLLRNSGYRHIVFGGGEPFCWPGNLRKAAQVAHKFGFFIQVGTNAITLPVERDWGLFDRFILPLDSHIALHHNELRQHTESHYALICRQLKRLQAAGVSVTVSTVVTRKNLRSLQNIFELLLALNHIQPFLHAWHLYRFIPQGRGGARNKVALAITATEYNTALEALHGETSFSIFRRRNMYGSRTVDFLWKEQDGFFMRKNNRVSRITLTEKTTETNRSKSTDDYHSERETPVDPDLCPRCSATQL